MTKSLITTAGMLFILTAFIGCDNSAPAAKSTEKSITSFSFTQALNPNLSAAEVDGVIDESGKTISVQVNGNALPNLIATFSISAGAKLEVAGALQESGVTVNDFSNPVTYRVTAEDGSTEDYTVSVTPKSAGKSITSFSFTQALNPNLSTTQVDGVIDETGKTITLKVDGNALPNLIATFSISAGAKLEVAGTLQESGVTTNDFSSPVTYRVTAEDGSTEDYVVSVQSASKSITSFSFTQALNPNLSTSQVNGVIDEPGKTITLQVIGNALPNLIATFSISAGAKLEVAGTLQESGVTSNDFSNPVTYRVTAEDGSTEDYTVSVTSTAAAPSSPSSPTGITGAKTGTGAGTVTITWETPDEAGIGNDGNPAVITKYILYRSETPGFALADTGVIATEITDATLREYEVSGLAAASTEYYFKLTAFNSVGEGSPTDEFNAFTPTDGLAFTPINSDTEYSVAKGTVSDTATGIAVPAYYEGKEVTTLGANAFDGFSQLVSIQLPGGLTDIGSYAFRDCSSLALTSLPDGITAIGMYAFENCSSLALTSLPNGLTSIETATFYYCSSLALTSLPDGITIIHDEAFEGCSKLALTSLPDKLTTIYPFAFSACSSLALTSLPSGLTSILQYAFSGCTGLTEITISRSTPPTASIEIFKDCTNLTKIKVPAANVDDYKTASGWDTYSDRIESI